MAISLGFFSTFITTQSPSLSFSPSSAPLLQPANLRMVRTITSAAVPKTPATATAGQQREPRGITKPRKVSPEMQAIVGMPEIPRTQALKLIWAYIKEHNLQDPEDKKVIVCDEKLKNIFAGKDRVGFLEIAGLIGPHFLK